MALPVPPGEAGAPHVPVLLGEVLEALAPLEGAVVVDATFGAGGYSRAILDGGAARVIGIDRDPTALALGAGLELEAEGRLVLVESPFDRLDAVVAEVLGRDGTPGRTLGGDETRVEGVVLDIGVSSMQLDRAERGFSFQQDGPLDMRMGRTGPNAADIVNTAEEAELVAILRAYGEERQARRIARAVIATRAEAAFERTGQLAACVAGVLPAPRPGQLHPATRSFQALRIAVNDELGQLVRALHAAERVLAPGGRLAVVTFHSLEDRIVKRFLQHGSGRAGQGSRHAPAEAAVVPRWERPARAGEAGEAELAANPRARSARLRAARRTEAPALEAALDDALLGLPEAPVAADFARRAARLAGERT
ncbi:MAG: 16S rRNA (cytosine(1402)-N(4))-methyltransferase RsmH [Pseudomonadota bacterium]